MTLSRRHYIGAGIVLALIVLAAYAYARMQAANAAPTVVPTTPTPTPRLPPQARTDAGGLARAGTGKGALPSSGRPTGGGTSGHQNT